MSVVNRVYAFLKHDTSSLAHAEFAPYERLLVHFLSEGISVNMQRESNKVLTASKVLLLFATPVGRDMLRRRPSFRTKVQEKLAEFERNRRFSRHVPYFREQILGSQAQRNAINV